MAPMRASPGSHCRAASVAAALLACVLPLAACTDDDEPSTPPDGAPPSATLELSLGPGAEDLAPEARDRLQNDVGDVLSTYVVDAYLGEYPRDDFVAALSSFTSGVADRAAQDLDLLTGSGFEGEPDEVVATELSASISTFAPGGNVLGVTARVDFAFDVTEGGETHEEAVHGRLMLEPVDGDWKIFGYAMTPGQRAEDGS